MTEKSLRRKAAMALAKAPGCPAALGIVRFESFGCDLVACQCRVRRMPVGKDRTAECVACWDRVLRMIADEGRSGALSDEENNQALEIIGDAADAMRDAEARGWDVGEATAEAVGGLTRYFRPHTATERT